MSTDTDLQEADGDLGEGEAADSETLKKVRAALKAANATNKGLEAENSDFREARTKQRTDALTEAVNGKGYPQTVLDTLVAKVQEADNDEFVALLTDLQGVAAPTNEGVVEAEAEPTVAKAPEGSTMPAPATLGQELAAASSGGASADPVMEALLSATNVDELNAVAAEHNLGDV